MEPGNWLTSPPGHEGPAAPPRCWTLLWTLQARGASPPLPATANLGKLSACSLSSRLLKNRILLFHHCLQHTQCQPSTPAARMLAVQPRSSDVFNWPLCPEQIHHGTTARERYRQHRTLARTTLVQSFTCLPLRCGLRSLPSMASIWMPGQRHETDVKLTTCAPPTTGWTHNHPIDERKIPESSQLAGSHDIKFTLCEGTFGTETHPISHDERPEETQRKEPKLASAESCNTS